MLLLYARSSPATTSPNVPQSSSPTHSHQLRADTPHGIELRPSELGNHAHRGAGKRRPIASTFALAQRLGWTIANRLTDRLTRPVNLASDKLRQNHKTPANRPLGDPGEASHNPKVAGSNPAPATSNSLEIEASERSEPVGLRGGWSVSAGRLRRAGGATLLSSRPSALGGLTDALNGSKVTHAVAFSISASNIERFGRILYIYAFMSYLT
jgi:hypothetical protein